jgi:hypothetical protein
VFAMVIGQPFENLSGYQPQSAQPYQVYEYDPSGLFRGQVKVEQVRLIYYSPFGGWRGSRMQSGPLPPQATYIQPMWSFSGHLVDGSVFEIFVQAVRSEFLQ